MTQGSIFLALCTFATQSSPIVLQFAFRRKMHNAFNKRCSTGCFWCGVSMATARLGQWPKTESALVKLLLTMHVFEVVRAAVRHPRIHVVTALGTAERLDHKQVTKQGYHGHVYYGSGAINSYYALALKSIIHLHVDVHVCISAVLTPRPFTG